MGILLSYWNPRNKTFECHVDGKHHNVYTFRAGSEYTIQQVFTPVNWTFCVTLSVMALASAELVLFNMLSWPRGGVLEIRSSMGRSEHVYDWDGSSHPL
jgi:alkyl sulfatase BDS1-like metallo-beta-lactamase superfamily hydrolase